MAWNCALSDAELAAWRAAHRVPLVAEGWQEWVIAIAQGPATSEARLASSIESALRGYFGAELVIGRSGGERGSISDVELTITPDGWAYAAPPGAITVQERIPASSRPTIKIPEGGRLRFAQVRFVYRGSLKDSPWFVWDFAPRAAAVTGGVGWEPECPTEADASLVAQAPLPDRPVPVEPQPFNLGDKVADAVKEGAKAATLLVGAGVVLALIMLARGRR